MRSLRRINIRILIWAALATAFCGVFPVHADMDTMILNDPATAVRQRPEVVFPHDVHMDGNECLTCHHQYEDGENVLDEGNLEEGNPEIKCSFCHTDQSDVDLRTAFHRQCMGCHINTRKAGADEKKAFGPEMCGSCHKRSE